jgi:hypothetical protein
VTGGSPRSTDAFYDVSYDRLLSPPAQTTPYGIVGGPGLCPSVVGTQVGFDEEIDIDLTKLDAGGGINPAYLPRDPKNNCAPVYPHQFIRVNTMFEVVKAAGGYPDRQASVIRTYQRPQRARRRRFLRPRNQLDSSGVAAGHADELQSPSGSDRGVVEQCVDR